VTGHGWRLKREDQATEQVLSSFLISFSEFLLAAFVATGRHHYLTVLIKIIIF